MKHLVIVLAIGLGLNIQAQDTLRVLFLGNSYTTSNNLPNLVSQFAAANGDVVITDSNTPGGHTLYQHSTNETSLEKIQQGNWDYVVLQDQSQVPTIDFLRFNWMYPGVESLHESITNSNLCAQTVMYMTWGRQYGGMQCTTNGEYCSVDFVDFSHMTDTLASAYNEIASMVGAKVAPVGKAWDYALTYSTTDPALVLHSSDESHPNYSGSYLAAAVFHGLIWGESPVENSFFGSLNQSQAAYLQEAAHAVLLEYSDYNSTISNDCTLHIEGNEIIYQPQGYYTYQWFDEYGEAIQEANNNSFAPTESGTYTIEVSDALGCTISCSEEIEIQGIEENNIEWVWVGSRTLKTSEVGLFNIQIFSGLGRLIHETKVLGDSYTIPELSKGLYMIAIENEHSKFVSKFIR